MGDREARKRETVMAHQAVLKARNFVETGTALGDMCEEAAPHFSQIVTIEKHADIADAASKRLAHFGNIMVVNGDSVEQLPRMLAALRGSSLFWLDAHEEARTGIPSPVIDEIYAIKPFICQGSAVLVDDIRVFGTHGWPSVPELMRALNDILPGRVLIVHDDMARAIPDFVYRAIYRETPAYDLRSV